MKTIIKPKKLTLVVEPYKIVSVSIILLLLTAFAKGILAWLIFGLFVALIGIVFIISGVLFLRTRIEITDQNISGWVHRQSFEMEWSKILVVKEETIRNKIYIFIATTDISVFIPQNLVNDIELMEIIKKHVFSPVFTDEADKKYKEMHQLDVNNRVIRVGTSSSIKIASWSGILFSGFIIFLGWRQGDIQSALNAGSIIFVLCGLLLVLSNTFLIADHFAIKMATFYGRFKLLWSEVERIEIAAGVIAFVGQNKHFVVDLGMADKNRIGFVEKILTHAKLQNIPIQNKLTVSRVPKNTRLPKGESF
ncbi:MAG: hypothetical protein HUU38_05225 [Anaerolineales bacterium]|nr:hypothetical protein [Anaerolineales bacterium]